MHAALRDAGIPVMLAVPGFHGVDYEQTDPMLHALDEVRHAALITGKPFFS
jgi:hypothetical protein